jgi:hypothetical protein
MVEMNVLHFGQTHLRLHDSDAKPPEPLRRNECFAVFAHSGNGRLAKITDGADGFLKSSKLFSAPPAIGVDVPAI